MMKANHLLENPLPTQILKLLIFSVYVEEIVLSMNCLSNSQDNLGTEKNCSNWTISKHIVDYSITVISTVESILCYKF